MSEEQVIVFVLENMESEIFWVRDVDATIETEEAINVNWPVRVGGLSRGQMDGGQRIGGECGEDIIVEGFHIKESASLEDQSCEVGCSEGCSELLLCEYRAEIMRVDASVVLIPLFGIDIPVSSEGIRFHAKSSRMEMDDHIELGEELQPAGLPAGQEFSGSKVLEVLVVSDNVNQSCGAFKVVSPSPEGLVDGE